MSTTSADKFKKLLAAYEDEVQRKQHKMGKRVDPRDVVEPKPATGYCSFLRGQQVIWSPSYEVIGTLTPATGTWLWGWADPSVDQRLATRVEAVRQQGQQWGIEVLHEPTSTLAAEQQAWELATIAVAISRADAMVRVPDANETRWLALFDGPAPSRSSASMRANRDSQLAPGRMSAVAPPVRPLSTSVPAKPGLQRTPTGGDEAEPTGATRAEIGQRLFELVPYALQAQLGAVQLRAQATPPSGPIGTVTMRCELTLHPAQPGSAPVPLNPSHALEEALVGLWMRCRDRQAPFRFASARFENGPQGFITQVFLEG